MSPSTPRASAHARAAFATLLIVLAATASCRSPSSSESTPVGDAALPQDAARTPPADGPVTVTRLRDEPYSFAYSSGYREPARLVITDAAAWRAAWDQVYATSGEVPHLPAVDFSKQSVILAALGTRRSGGYSIIVADAAVAQGALRVTINSIAPGARCGVTGALTQPVDLATVPRLSLPVVFVEHDSVNECP